MLVEQNSCNLVPMETDRYQTIQQSKNTYSYQTSYSYFFVTALIFVLYKLSLEYFLSLSAAGLGSTGSYLFFWGGGQSS